MVIRVFGLFFYILKAERISKGYEFSFLDLNLKKFLKFLLCYNLKKIFLKKFNFLFEVFGYFY